MMDSTVTPNATVRAVVLDAAVLTTRAAAVAMTSDGVETDAVTTTEPGVTSNVMSAGVVPLPIRVARLALKPSRSKVSTVPSTRIAKVTTWMYALPG